MWEVMNTPADLNLGIDRKKSPKRKKGEDRKRRDLHLTLGKGQCDSGL